VSLPEKCPKCGETNWVGVQNITPPSSFKDGALWHRRSYCLLCPWAVEEIEPGGLVAITSRTERIKWWGRNPWI